MIERRSILKDWNYTADILRRHLLTKQENSRWLGRVAEWAGCQNHSRRRLLPGQPLQDYFPFEILPYSKTVKMIPVQVPRGSWNVKDKRGERQKEIGNVYFIAMPMVPKYKIHGDGTIQYDPDNRIRAMIDDIENNSYRRRSALRTTLKVVLFIGINRQYSLDSNENTAFKEYVARLQLSARMEVHVLPFLWNPYKLKKTSFDAGRVLPVDKCFMLMKSYVPKATINLRWLINQNAKVPYQKIRDFILHSNPLKEVSRFFRNVLPSTPQYMLSLDDDFVSFRIGSACLLSTYDDIVRDYFNDYSTLPDLMSTGYCASSSDPALYAIGLEYDLYIREAMAKTLLPYMPEPNFAFRLYNSEDLGQLTWFGGGKDMTTESRRLIQNAVSKGLIDPSKFVFSAACPIQLKLDQKWQKAELEKRGDFDYEEVNREVISELPVLKSLSDLRQSHADLQILAHNICNGLGGNFHGQGNPRMKAMVTIKGLLQNFDPLSLIYFLKGDRKNKGYSEVYFESVMEHYDWYSQALWDSIENGTLTLNERNLPYTQFEQLWMDILEDSYNYFVNAEDLLHQYYDKEEIDKILFVSLDTGRAKFEFLNEFE